ncbi:MAG TPA: NAD(P)-dependent oxidoreductase [Xanthobacteraceae bacterium]|nr:NAD(P)-dependent oxidoreductase [Xanthobacteraceae bacterium]
MRAVGHKGTVGVVGLGIMGGAFARNLVADGWRVIGHDIDPARRRTLARAGVEIVQNAVEVARDARSIITSLPHPAALQSTVAPLCQNDLRPLVVIEASTFTLADKLKAAQMLQAAGHTLLDCPISGTGAQAVAKDIVVYASGDAKAIKRSRPIFSSFARAAYDLGAFGNGSRMKYVANLLVAINNVAAAEAMVLGMKSGLEPRMIYEMVRSGAGNSRIFELRAPLMVKNRYDRPTMKVSVWQKDMAVIAEFAEALRCPTPLFTATRSIYDAALAAGHADHDTASVCAVMEKKAGLRRRRARPGKR